MKVWILGVVLILNVTAFPGAAKAVTANEMRAFCQDLLEAEQWPPPGDSTSKLTYELGFCVGAFWALQRGIYLADDSRWFGPICLPLQLSGREAVFIFSRYLDDNEDAGDNTWDLVARNALVGAFPCLN